MLEWAKRERGRGVRRGRVVGVAGSFGSGNRCGAGPQKRSGVQLIAARLAPAPVGQMDAGSTAWRLGADARAPTRGWALLGALLSALIGAAALSFGLSGGGSQLAARSAAPAMREGFSPGGLMALQLAAQAPISAGLGAGDRVYRAAASGGGYATQSPAQRLHARFAATGLLLTSGETRVGLRLAGFGYGSAERRLAPTRPTARANRVVYQRAGVTEWYANGPLGLEQGFTVGRAPSTRTQTTLTLTMDLSGTARVSIRPGGREAEVRATSGPTLRYTGLQASDASGRVLESWLELRGTRLLIRVAAANARFPLRVDPMIQQGVKLTGSAEIGKGGFGETEALSADGNTALVGAFVDNAGVGAAYVFTRSGSSWIQQGKKLTGSGEVGAGEFGSKVALSADGNTALIGGIEDNGQRGAAWVFTRSGSTWTQQGEKLTGGEESGGALFGSVALSADGNTALIGGYNDSSVGGAAWVFTRSGSIWTQQGKKLTPTGEIGGGSFGESVALSADGNTALMTDAVDNGGKGAAWVFTRSGSIWTQQEKLTASGEVGEGRLGFGGGALSADGNTMLVGGPGDNGGVGAAWVFTRSGSTWTQQGAKLVGSGAVGPAAQGITEALSADGNTALFGGPSDNANAGAAWLFTRSGTTWTQQGGKFTGTGAQGEGGFGQSIAVSSDGDTALVGGYADNNHVGSAWVFVNAPSVGGLNVASGPQAGGTSVIISGSNFLGAGSVSFGATPAKSFTVNSSEAITAVAPAGTGIVDVTVTNSGGASRSVEADRFSYLPPEAVEEREAAVEAAAGLPTVTRATPDAVLQSGGTVTLTGANYVGVKAVTFGSHPASSFKVNSATSISAVVPALKIRKGCQPQVVTEAGGSAPRPINEVECIPEGPAPTVKKLTPNKGPSGGGQVLTVTGTGFAGVTGVMVGGAAATQVRASSESSVSVVVPAHAEGSADVVVSTPNGTSPTSTKDVFKYGRPATPTVRSLSPAEGPRAGGSAVTIAGTNFVPGMTFVFGKVTVSGSNCISTSCTVSTPAGKAGIVDVIAQVGLSKSRKSRPADTFIYR